MDPCWVSWDFPMGKIIWYLSVGISLGWKDTAGFHGKSFGIHPSNFMPSLGMNPSWWASISYPNISFPLLEGFLVIPGGFHGRFLGIPRESWFEIPRIFTGIGKHSYGFQVLRISKGPPNMQKKNWLVKNLNQTQQTTSRKILILASLFWDDFLYINAMPVFGVINLFWESVFLSTPHGCFKKMEPNWGAKQWPGWSRSHLSQLLDADLAVSITVKQGKGLLQAVDVAGSDLPVRADPEGGGPRHQGQAQVIRTQRRKA